MASHLRGEYGAAAPPSDTGAPVTSKFHPSDSVAEWRSREQLEPSPPSTSLAYWDTDEDEDVNSHSATGMCPFCASLFTGYGEPIECSCLLRAFAYYRCSPWGSNRRPFAARNG